VYESLEPRRLFIASVPRFDHVVVLIEENSSYEDIVGKRDAK